MADLDTKAADTFQPTNHRAGYGDRLAFLMQWLSSHPDATLASGEGRVLLDEITRLRVVADANYRNMERLGVEVERLRALIDAVLALPTFNMTPYIQGVEPAGAALSDARHYGEWLESDHVLNALQVPQ
jgi:hypothetical protein